MSTKRREQIERMLAEDPDDVFLRYSLALEMEAAQMQSKQSLQSSQAQSAALEQQASAAQAQVDLFAAAPDEAPAPASAVDHALAGIDPDALSPREALEALYQLKKLAGG